MQRSKTRCVTPAETFDAAFTMSNNADIIAQSASRVLSSLHRVNSGVCSAAPDLPEGEACRINGCRCPLPTSP
jgi:hypothetical protein